MGLAFLASGKYFLINNGPYYQNYDIPIEQGRTNSTYFSTRAPPAHGSARSPLTYESGYPRRSFSPIIFPMIRSPRRKWMSRH